MRIVLLAEAAQEFEAAAIWLEAEQAGLGERFRNEVDAHIAWITSHPSIPRVRLGGYRRLNLQVFPYYIAYTIRGSTLWILAIAHCHRRPEYWIERASPN